MKRLPLLLVAVAFISGAVALGQGAASYDLVLAGGRVIDPGSGLDAVGHVGITGGSVLAVSTSPLQGRVTIDAAGLVVAPEILDVFAEAGRAGAPAHRCISCTCRALAVHRRQTSCG